MVTDHDASGEPPDRPAAQGVLGWWQLLAAPYCYKCRFFMEKKIIVLLPIRHLIP